MAPNSSSVDDLLRSVASRGLRLANLFQFPVTSQEPGPGSEPGPWRWQANVTDGQRYWEFGRGATAAEALRAALFISATSRPPPETPRRPPVPDHQPPPPAAEDIEI